MTAAPAAGGPVRWSGALLVVAVFGVATLTRTWVRGTGSPIPGSADITQSDVTRAGTAESLSATGINVSVGAALLILGCVLGALALWRASPRYRPRVAAYSTICVSAIAVATAMWFTGSHQHVVDALSRSTDVHGESVQLTFWPWVTMTCFAIACVIGIMLVPRTVHLTEDATG